MRKQIMKNCTGIQPPGLSLTVKGSSFYCFKYLVKRSLGHDCCVLVYNTSASVGWWRGIKSITWWWWICWITNSWTTWHDSNWSWLRIHRVRVIYPCYIDISSGNDSRGCWCNSHVAWTITIAIVPPENKHNDAKCYKSEPAKLDYKLHFSEHSENLILVQVL